MITLYRKIKLWTLKTKWELALWQFLDKQIMELIADPEKLEKKFVPYLAKLIHKTSDKNG